MNPIIMHINYCELDFNTLGKSIDEVCKKASEWGFDGVEFRGYLPADYKGTRQEYMNEIKAAKAKYGLSQIMYGYGVTGVSNADKDVREKAIADAIAFFTEAREITDTTVCNTFADCITNKDGRVQHYEYDLHGSHIATEDEWKYTAEGFAKIGEAVHKLGMRIGFETHMNYIHDVPQATKKLLDMIDSPAVGANMDYGNTIYFVNVPSPEETVKLYGDKLFHMHLKNSVGIRGAGRHPVALWDGEINHRTYMKAVLEAGYQGPIGIEAPRGGDREWFARQDLAYFKTLASEIGMA